MPKDKFSIYCPSCQEWSDYEESLESIAMKPNDDIGKIINESKDNKKNGEDDQPKRLLRCNNSRFMCPAPFEAMIYKNKDKDFENVLKAGNKPESWSLPRFFKLRIDHNDTKRNDYCAMLFNTQPVRRIRYIELESIMDKELVSRLIAGICAEIDTPLTFYAAHIFESKDKDRNPEVFWIPIEGYSNDQERLVPPRYNSFCKTCRDISMKKLISFFNSKKQDSYNVKKCKRPFVKDGKCGSTNPVCDSNYWDYCPAFLNLRDEKCPCYNSDLKLIRSIQGEWPNEALKKSGISRSCYAGFTEIGFPIEVHGHLVGVAITGQMFSKPDQIKTAEQFITNKNEQNEDEGGRSSGYYWSNLDGEEPALDAARYILIGSELEKKREGKKTTFFVEPEEGKEIRDKIEEKIKDLLPNLKRFESNAEAQYRELRTRAELVFRREVLGIIENNKTKLNFKYVSLPLILKRMQEFWAFKGSYLLFYSSIQKEVSVIAASIKGNTKNKKDCNNYNFPLNIKSPTLSPYPYMYIHGGDHGSDSLEFKNAIEFILKKIDPISGSNGLIIRNGDCEYVVGIPKNNDIIIFIFTVRDKPKITGLVDTPPQTMSMLCKDMVFETCFEVAKVFDSPFLDSLRHIETNVIASHHNLTNK